MSASKAVTRPSRGMADGGLSTPQRPVHVARASSYHSSRGALRGTRVRTAVRRARADGAEKRARGLVATGRHPLGLPSMAATSEEVVTSDAGAEPSGNGATVVPTSSNGNGATSSLSSSFQEEKVDLDACEAGQLETCAQTKEEISKNPEPSPGAKSSDAETSMAAPDRWNRLKETSTFKRTVEIWRFVFVFFFKLWVVNSKWSYAKEDRDKEAKRGIKPEAKSERTAELAVWLRERLVTLGPTFIKIGQQFSTRSDILSPEFIAELVKLQDRVPAFPSDVALATVEKELGVTDWRQKFSHLDPEPIAAASLGQVHRARLMDGTEVVVKVQRPDLKELFDVDTKNIRFVAQILQSIDPKTDGAARDWVAIYDECCRILYQEIDYKLEGKYADGFRENFSDLPWVKVPKVYWNLTSEKILTLEYSPGIKVSDKSALIAKGVDPAVIARYSVECYLQQILVKGLFHADPHPGNIAVDASDPQDPKLIFYDFGMMGKIPNNIRKGLADFFYAVYSNDVDAALDGLVKMNVLVVNGGADMTAIRRTGRFFLDSFKTRLREQREQRKLKKMEFGGRDGSKAVTKEEKKEKRKKILSNIGQDLLVVANDQPFRFPALFTFVVRAFSVLDGIGKQLDPRFDISEISAPYARDLLLEQRPGFSKLQDKYQKGADRQWEATKGLFTAPLKINKIEGILDSLEAGDTKLRVRALEAERALQRVSVTQTVTVCVVMAAVSLNTATVLSVVANTAPPLVRSACFWASAVFGALTLKNLAALNKLNKKEKKITGMA